VTASRHAILEEAKALRSALADFSSDPQLGCPYKMDVQAWSGDPGPQAEGRRRLWGFTQDQVRLIFVNAYDHLVTMGRVLGGDGAMPLFSYSSLSRVACEAAVRFAWIIDVEVSCEERVMRGAVSLLVSANERLKGVMAIPDTHFNESLRRKLIDNCQTEVNSAEALITGAGLTLARGRDGKTFARLELDSPKISVPVKLDITKLMGEMLPDSPSWYNVGSSVVHSRFWGLRDAVISAGPDSLELGPNLLEVGAAAQTAISASGLIIARCAAYYGHDSQPYIKRTRKRREALDPHMKRFATSQKVWFPAG
jgi:hypothetical protein